MIESVNINSAKTERFLWSWVMSLNFIKFIKLVIILCLTVGVDSLPFHYFFFLNLNRNTHFCIAEIHTDTGHFLYAYQIFHSCYVNVLLVCSMYIKQSMCLSILSVHTKYKISYIYSIASKERKLQQYSI